MKPAHGRAPSQLERRDCTYNLFRSKFWPELLCAVPEDRPVPSFIRPGQWLFERPLRPVDARPQGFYDRAAAAGSQMNGFYLFQSLAANENRAAAPAREHEALPVPKAPCTR